jgi:hypothetical protein
MAQLIEHKCEALSSIPNTEGKGGKKGKCPKGTKLLQNLCSVFCASFHSRILTQDLSTFSVLQQLQKMLYLIFLLL